jgi:energy-coupling factor transport system ATP-binding protein
VLKQASFQIYSGEVLAIVGANGSGKTTLLQAMAGILKLQKGKLLFHGKPLARWERAERTARIGYLAQNPLTFFIEETVERELRQAAARAVSGESGTFGKRPATISTTSTSTTDAPNGADSAGLAVLQVARSLGLERVLGSHPCDLSEGERQLAALAALLLAGSELLLLDEPTKGLDPVAKRRWGERLQELQAAGKTVVMVTHDLEFAAEYATRCTMMFDGMLAAEGAPQPFFRDNLYYTTAACQLLRGD